MQLTICLLLTQFVSVLTTAHMLGVTPICQDSGYCSMGKLAPFVGDLSPSTLLQLRIVDCSGA